MSLIIGSHVSYKKNSGLVGSVEEALSYGANAFMFYTGAPQNTARIDIDINNVIKAHEILQKNNISSDNVIIHAPYIINPANDNNKDFNINFLKQEIDRVEKLGFYKIVLHPGSHVGLGTEKGIKNIIDVINDSINDTNVIVCLETMAGKGSECGVNFLEIKKIIDGIYKQDNIGVCMDTCHLNDAGYDMSDFDKILDDFDNIIGLEKLKCIHINDSKNIINAHKDRHENIGYGTIGFDNLINIIYNNRILNIPKILETPYVSAKIYEKDRSYPPYKFEIEMIKNRVFDEELLNKIRNYYK